MRGVGFTLHNVVGAGFARPLTPYEVERNIRALSAYPPTACPECGGSEWVVDEIAPLDDEGEELRVEVCENCGWPW